MKINKNIGFTILEVLIASIVVSVIMLGVVTMSISLSNNARYFFASYFVSQSTQVTLNHILTQAALASGTSTALGFAGVDTLITDSATISPSPLATKDLSRNTFCIHQNLSIKQSNSVLGDFDPTYPNAHRWLCYTYLSPNIYWCLRSYDYNNPPGSSGYAASAPGACSDSDNFLGKAMQKPATKLYLKNVSPNQKTVFEVTINNCLFPDKVDGSCAPENINNPYVSKYGTALPSGHSS